MGKVLEKSIPVLLPPLLAFGAVAVEKYLSAWAKDRAALLPLIILVIGASLLNPRVRHLLVVALCYGVAFLAVRETFRADRWHLPFPMDQDLAETLIMTALLLVAALSAVAAVGETLRPGAVWARRCYFGAASLYFTGLGINCYGPGGSWQSLVLCATGLCALFGCLFAHRVVASEQEEDQEVPFNDEAAQMLRDAEHLRTLRDKEWQDPTAASDQP